MGTFIEDSDEMPQISSGSTLFVKVNKQEGQVALKCSPEFCLKLI